MGKEQIPGPQHIVRGYRPNHTKPNPKKAPKRARGKGRKWDRENQKHPMGKSAGKLGKKNI